MSSFPLSPETTHVGDEFGASGRIVIAYGHFTDDEQAVLLLVPADQRAPYDTGSDSTCLPPGAGGELEVMSPDAEWAEFNGLVPGNYITLMLHESGTVTEVRAWWNVHDASNWMQEQMGQDR